MSTPKLERKLRRYFESINSIINVGLALILIVISILYYFYKPFRTKADDLLYKANATLGNYNKCIIYCSANVKLENVCDALPNSSSFLLAQVNINDVHKKIMQKSWVAFCSVHKVFPNSLIIKILEREPIALWKNGQNTFAIDKLGHAFEIIISKDHAKVLPYLAGDGANLNANKLINSIDQHKLLKDNFCCAIYIGCRRWNVILRDGKLIKLPENPDLTAAFIKASQIIEADLSHNIEMIDLRNENKVYIKCKD